MEEHILAIHTKMVSSGQDRLYYRFGCSCGAEGGFRCRKREATADWQAHMYPALQSRLDAAEKLKDCLEAIRDYERTPMEIEYDEFAYWRIVEAYREAARNGLAAYDAALQAGGEET